eukprot:TRINITY_DN11929_c0_g1_i1.p1 TRINITY_DN11929_c0_g1~~TRINITY_DN11929_c0_g1_i1.p1  ORF type:complete len:812 (+),score=229.84 TRINITY_DN11929_c0_g1_i1:76-2436(+)
MEADDSTPRSPSSPTPGWPPLPLPDLHTPRASDAAAGAAAGAAAAAGGPSGAAPKRRRLQVGDLPDEWLFNLRKVAVRLQTGPGLLALKGPAGIEKTIMLLEALKTLPRQCKKRRLPTMMQHGGCAACVILVPEDFRAHASRIWSHALAQYRVIAKQADDGTPARGKLPPESLEPVSLRLQQPEDEPPDPEGEPPATPGSVPRRPKAAQPRKRQRLWNGCDVPVRVEDGFGRDLLNEDAEDRDESSEDIYEFAPRKRPRGALRELAIRPAEGLLISTAPGMTLVARAVEPRAAHRAPAAPGAASAAPAGDAPREQERGRVVWRYTIPRSEPGRAPEPLPLIKPLARELCQDDGWLPRTDCPALGERLWSSAELEAQDELFARLKVRQHLDAPLRTRRRRPFPPPPVLLVQRLDECVAHLEAAGQLGADRAKELLSWLRNLGRFARVVVTYTWRWPTPAAPEPLPPEPEACDVVHLSRLQRRQVVRVARAVVLCAPRADPADTETALLALRRMPWMPVTSLQLALACANRSHTNYRHRAELDLALEELRTRSHLPLEELGDVDNGELPSPSLLRLFELGIFLASRRSASLEGIEAADLDVSRGARQRQVQAAVRRKRKAVEKGFQRDRFQTVSLGRAVYAAERLAECVLRRTGPAVNPKHPWERQQLDREEWKQFVAEVREWYQVEAENPVQVQARAEHAQHMATVLELQGRIRIGGTHCDVRSAKSLQAAERKDKVVDPWHRLNTLLINAEAITVEDARALQRTLLVPEQDEYGFELLERLISLQS